MHPKLVHVNGGCNPHTHAISNPSTANPDVLAYGSANGIAVYKTSEARVERIVAAHENTVTHVEWIHQVSNEWVVSGSVDGSVKLWDTTTWELHSIVHESSIAIASIGVATRAHHQELIVGVGLSDGNLLVYSGNTQTKEWTLLKELQLGTRQIMEDMAISELSPNTFVVAAGGVDSKVHLFCIDHAIERVQKIGFLTGHVDWIRSIEMCYDPSQQVLYLATASQDSRIRIWTIQRSQVSENDQDLEALTVDLSFTVQSEQQGPQHYSVSREAILTGHTDWVTSIHWKPISIDDKTSSISLLSASMDNTILYWKPSETLGESWYQHARVGEIGGNGIGFVACKFLQNGRQILGHTFQGQFNRWSSDETGNRWTPAIVASGHRSAVVDVAWDPSQKYFVSVSSDETSRMWAPWVHSDPATQEELTTWHEISRPQIHGYSLTCIAFVENRRHCYVSGADEKVLRAFDSTQVVVDRYISVSRQADSSASKQRIEAAYVPELSLTNKASSNASPDQATVDVKAEKGISSDPPLPEELARQMLWPEIHKLYGHGNELLAVASNHSGTLIASACKAREAQFAAVWLWNTETWHPLNYQLQGHASSIVQLAFSPCDQYLASVSKDRQLCIYGLAGEKYELVCRLKAHKRIVWSCSWSYDSKIIATGSRDHYVCIWGFNNETKQWVLMSKLPEFASAVTSVAFAPRFVEESGVQTYVLAVGLESGAIEFWKASTATPQKWECASRGSAESDHFEAVKRIAWKNQPTEPLCYVSCSADHSIRLVELDCK